MSTRLRPVYVNQETSNPESREMTITCPGWGWRFLEIISEQEDRGDLVSTINRLLGLSVMAHAEIHGIFVDGTGQRN
jgi:hypothetical protein